MVPVTTWLPTQTTFWQWDLKADGFITPMAFDFALPIDEGQQVSVGFAFRPRKVSFWLVMVNHNTCQSSYHATSDEVLTRLGVARFAPVWLTGFLGAIGLGCLALAICWAVLDWAFVGAVRWGDSLIRFFFPLALLASSGCLGCLAFNRWQRQRSQQTWT